MKRRFAIALVLGLSGCSPIIGLLVRATEGDGGSIAVGQTVRGSTQGASDRWAPSCGAHDNSGDRAYVFVPQHSGIYAVDLHGQYDCVLGVFDEQQSPIACNDDSGSVSHSRVEARLEAGHAYALVADGYNGGEGRFELTLSALTLDSQGLAERELLAGQRGEGDTQDGTDRFTPPCGATPGSPDEVWTFTPTSSGPYVIDLFSEHDGVLAVYREGESTPIACNDDHTSSGTSQVTPTLDAGTTYQIVVDGSQGAAGGYGVVIQDPSATPPPNTGPSPGSVENEAALEARCLGAPRLRSGTLIAGFTASHRDAAPSCGGGAGSDEVYRVEVDRPQILRVAARSPLSPIIELRVGCSGGRRVVVCEASSGALNGVPLARIGARVSPGQTYYVIVDAAQPGEGELTLDVSLEDDPQSAARVRE